MSNPYAPPEDRPRTQDDPPGAPEAARPEPAPAPRPAVTVPTEADRRSPDGSPDPEGVVKTAERARLVGILLLSSVLVATLPLPWQAAALLFALAALVMGIRTLVGAVRARARGMLPGVVAALVVLSALWSFGSTGRLLAWSVEVERQECMAGALTVTATQACEQAYQKGLVDLQDSLRERANS